MQAAGAQTASRKRPRPQSGDATQPKEEPADEPASQRPRIGDVEHLQPGSFTSEAGQQSSLPSGLAPAGLAPAAVASAAEGQPASGDGGSADQSLRPTTPVDDQDSPAAFPPDKTAVKTQVAATLQGATDSNSAGKGVGDAAMGEPTGTPGESMESNQRVEEHFQPSLPMQEMVVNFLLRMAFVIGGDRDHDLQVCQSAGSLPQPSHVTTYCCCFCLFAQSIRPHQVLECMHQRLLCNN